jgi:hypothetical protein
MVTTTELQAVNVALLAIGENPVNSLSSADATVDSSSALKQLGEANREIQEQGWAWNSEESYILASNADGSVSLPLNTLKVKQAWFSGGWNKELVQRGNQLYDRKAHSFNIKATPTNPVKVDIVFLLEFTQLPQAARTYIALEAANRLVAAKLISSTASRAVGAQLSIARTRVEQAEADADQSTMADNPHVHAVRSRRRGPR